MRYRPLLVTAALVAAIDALTKAVAVALSRWMPIHMPGGWALQVAHNNGVIGGGGAGTILPPAFAIMAVAEFAVLLFINRHQRGLLWAAGFGLMIGGAAGNLGDHQIFGYSVDWIWAPHPPIIFNLADVAAACGQVLLIALQVLSLRASRVRPRVAVTR